MIAPGALCAVLALAGADLADVDPNSDPNSDPSRDDTNSSAPDTSPATSTAPPAPAPTPATTTTTTTTTTTSTAQPLSAWTPPAVDAPAVFVGAQVFAGVEAPFVSTSTTTVPAFRLDRAELGGGLATRDTALLVRLETVRSAGAQSAFGIDGDSIVPRLRLGFGVWRPHLDLFGVPVVVETRLGLVPNLWLQRLESENGARGLSPLASERTGFFGTSDLGASVVVDVNNRVYAAVSVENGEGKNEVELNADKDVVLAAGGRVPLVDVDGAPVFAYVHALVRHGSVGLDAVAHNAAAVAVGASHRSAHVGVEGVLGDGNADLAGAGLAPAVVGAFADVTVIDDVCGLAARYDAYAADLAVDDAIAHQGTVALFGNLGALGDAVRVRLYVGAEARVVGENVGPVVGVPDAGQSFRFFVTLDATGGAVLPLPQ